MESSSVSVRLPESSYLYTNFAPGVRKYSPNRDITEKSVRVTVLTAPLTGECDAMSYANMEQPSASAATDKIIFFIKSLPSLKNLVYGNRKSLFGVFSRHVQAFVVKRDFI